MEHKIAFRTTRYSVISKLNENKEIESYCSMGNQKFYVEDINCLDKIKNGYIQVIELHKKILKQNKILSLETKLEVNFE